MADMITVYKLDYQGNETWQYSGAVIARGETWLRLEAFFYGPEGDAGYMVWRHGDRFVEYFYTDRWYNIFEIHDAANDTLKGWYCNITYPATITAESVSWRDLALDVWISPAGEVRILDEDEFAALPIDEETRNRAWAAVDDLRAQIARCEEPFNTLTPT
jgi:predicted RNA-binding protein associated with RNAse of E/G family